MLSTPGLESGKVISPPLLGGKGAARLEGAAEGSSGTVEPRMCGDVAVYKHFMTQLSLHEKCRWRLRLRIMLRLRLMIHT